MRSNALGRVKLLWLSTADPTWGKLSSAFKNVHVSMVDDACAKESCMHCKVSTWQASSRIFLDCNMYPPGLISSVSDFRSDYLVLGAWLVFKEPLAQPPCQASKADMLLIRPFNQSSSRRKISMEIFCKRSRTKVLSGTLPGNVADLVKTSDKTLGASHPPATN